MSRRRAMSGAGGGGCGGRDPASRAVTDTCDLIIAGARQHGLPEEYIRQIGQLGGGTAE